MVKRGHNKLFIPTAAGSEVARIIHEKPEKTDSQLREYDRQLLDYYRHTGMTQRDPQRAYKKIIRNQLRVVQAPLAHGIEEELRLYIRAKAQQAVVSPDDLAVTHFDRRLTHGKHTYSREKLNFVRASAVLSHAAAVRFIGNTLNLRNNYAPILDAYCRLDREMARLTTFTPFKRRLEPCERLKGHVIAANVTVLDTFIPLAEHLLSHVSLPDIPATILERIAEVSWTASTKDDFFRDHFAYQYMEAEPPKACPFVHSAEAIALGGVWQVQSLKTPWSPPGYCPINIPLYSKSLGSYVTGSQLRFTSAIHIAKETLWAE